jgi:hypothetical protein
VFAVTPNQLKDSAHVVIFNAYQEKGVDAALQVAKALMDACNKSSSNIAGKSAVKGEVSEAILEVMLRKFQNLVSPSVIIKNFCIRAQTGNQRTTEIDLAMFTPVRIYLFECKSYNGKKTLNNECTVKSPSITKDIYKQSLVHMEILNQYMDKYRINRMWKGTSPYKLYFFEFSSGSIIDKRNDKWKHTMPLITLDNIDKVLCEEFLTPQKANWDLERAWKCIKQLYKLSESNFKDHMIRMYSLNGGNK